MRGDHPAFARPLILPTGPPPHARGSLHGLAKRLFYYGPTPACAGITSRASGGWRPGSAHPRMRGDHAVAAVAAGAWWGPPPHARGSQRVGRPPGRVARPTPACAGITPARSVSPVVLTAHPRMRGDHRSRQVVMLRESGPPPHARGSQVGDAGDGGGARPTPACAGITRRVGRGCRLHGAHPRMRGDHRYTSAELSALVGPPPHARGSPTGVGRPGPRRRPTPACAGITVAATRGSRRSTAHPRMRGDHGGQVADHDQPSGPPPHARGSRPSAYHPPRGDRPTPACAGIT